MVRSCSTWNRRLVWINAAAIAQLVNKLPAFERNNKTLIYRYHLCRLTAWKSQNKTLCFRLYQLVYRRHSVRLFIFYCNFVLLINFKNALKTGLC